MWLLLLFYLKDKPQRRVYILGLRMVAEFVSPPNVEAQRNESIISRMMVGHYLETQKNCMTSYHLLLLLMNSYKTWLLYTTKFASFWSCVDNDSIVVSFFLSLTQSQVRVPPYIFLGSLMFPFHKDGLFLYQILHHHNRNFELLLKAEWD